VVPVVLVASVLVVSIPSPWAAVLINSKPEQLGPRARLFNPPRLKDRTCRLYCQSSS
jgi:hypothetical protein